MATVLPCFRWDARLLGVHGAHAAALFCCMAAWVPWYEGGRSGSHWTDWTPCSMTRTLNLRCGSDIRDGLRQAGIEGDFLEVADPWCMGPVLPEPKARRRARHRFLTQVLGAPEDEVESKLEAETAGLQSLDDYERITLWFEHDLYDQFILARVLAELQSRPEVRDRTRLICIDRAPGPAQGPERFTGLGQLTPQQLALLPDQARPVTEAMTVTGQRLVAALTAPSPQRLLALMHDLQDDPMPALPFLARAIGRYLADYPDDVTGTALTHRLVLRLMADGTRTPGALFARVQHLEPAPWMGDLQFWAYLKELADAEVPAIRNLREWKEPVELTGMGWALATGAADWFDANGIDRWHGGTHLKGAVPAWRVRGTGTDLTFIVG